MDRLKKRPRPPRKEPLRSYRCAICGGPVIELEQAYRCQAEMVTWDRQETSLLKRFDT